MADKVVVRRCAIYVRKSSEEGLDMSYNALEAQRDACAAYIASQRHEGWRKIETVYEDGGYSGGTMERPGLQKLLTDVAAGRIDIIVVYKIDRLTRSLTDFAKLNEALDANSVSFVAVTQQFNTSTSMGRLTLNVLLSFAQFEREVAGERIRDKVAASKKKGMWMGGPVPLGYAVKDRRLVIVPEEADIVRRMFNRYLELRSVHQLQRELEHQGVRSRLRTLRDDRSIGGAILGRGAISHMLKNPLYLGRVRHGSECHVGQHEAIVDRDTFDYVRAALADAGPGDEARTKRASAALLKGLVFDTTGNRLQPSHSNKKGVRYHYYTSARRLRSASDDPQGVRVPAGDLERIVTTAVINRLKDKTVMLPWLTEHTATGDLPTLLARCADTAVTIASSGSDADAVIRSLIDRVQVSKATVGIKLSEEGLATQLGITSLQITDEAEPDPSPLHISITSHLLRCGKQVKLVLGLDAAVPSDPNPKLVEMVVNARRWFASLLTGECASIAQVAERVSLDRTYIGRVITLAFLAPDIVEAILFGTHDASLTPERLRKACPLPVRWDEQRALLLV